MIERFINLDIQISEYLSQLIPHNYFFDTVFLFLSLEGNWIIIWAILVGIIFFTEVRQDKRFIAYFLISMVITYVSVNPILKNVFQRERPWVSQKLETASCPKTFSFPSGHASGAFAGATILAAFDKKRRPIYYITAFLISFSRIYLICHYFFDVLIGGFIGYVISRMVLEIKLRKEPIV